MYWNRKQSITKCTSIESRTFKQLTTVHKAANHPVPRYKLLSMDPPSYTQDVPICQNINFY